MIRINNVHIPLDHDDEIIRISAAKELRINPNAIKSTSIFRRSVDARKKDNIFFLCSIDVELNINEDKILKKCKNAVKAVPYKYEVKEWRVIPLPL